MQNERILGFDELINVLVFHYGALSDLRHFFANGSPLKMKKKMYFISPQLNVLQIFKFLSSSFGHVEKLARLER